jgi:hypothetical protein
VFNVKSARSNLLTLEFIDFKSFKSKLNFTFIFA